MGDAGAGPLIMQVAHRLSGAVRASDTVSRCAHNAFVVVTDDLKAPADAVIIARRLLEAVVASISVAGLEPEPSVSIGVAVTSSSDALPEEVLRQADVAMSAARQQGGGCFTLYEEAASTTT
jgi:diguanylate cyclase (GGDEF)-like protein